MPTIEKEWIERAALLKQLAPAEQRVVVFLQDTGLRMSEFTDLRWKDVYIG
jgi:hypothetical protein